MTGMKFWASGIAFVLLGSGAAAGISCENVKGNWTGTMEGAFSGTTSMSVDQKCRVKWKLPDGRTNNCKFSGKKSRIEYACSLGSRGTVAFGAASITLENVYTANRHGAYKVRVSRVD